MPTTLLLATPSRFPDLPTPLMSLKQKDECLTILVNKKTQANLSYENLQELNPSNLDKKIILYFLKSSYSEKAKNFEEICSFIDTRVSRHQIFFIIFVTFSEHLNFMIY